MRHHPGSWFILVASLVLLSTERAAAQTLQPVLRASIHDQNGDGARPQMFSQARPRS
jgi:hypothetical protein